MSIVLVDTIAMHDCSKTPEAMSHLAVDDVFGRLSRKAEEGHGWAARRMTG